VAPSASGASTGAAVDALVLRGLSREREERFETAEEMAHALEQAIPPATTREVGEWVRSRARGSLAMRAECVARIEAGKGGEHVADESDVETAQHAPLDEKSPVSTGTTRRMGSVSVGPRSVPTAATANASRASALGRVALGGAIVVIGALVLARYAAPPHPPSASEGGASAAAGASAAGVSAVPGANAAGAAATSAPAPVVPPSPPIASVAVPDASGLSTVVAPIPLASRAPAPAGRAPSAPFVSAARSAPAPPATAPSTRDPADCYFLDADGIKHVKPECKSK
jgi:eukaryotic-like serine/threonine-protein kinase